MFLALEKITRDEFLDILERAGYYETGDYYVDEVADCLLIQNFIKRNFNLAITAAEAKYFWENMSDGNNYDGNNNWTPISDSISDEIKVCKKFTKFILKHKKDK